MQWRSKLQNQGLFFFLNLPLLTSLSCFWKAFLEKPMLTFLEQIFLASCLYNRRLSTTSFHCLQTWKLFVKKHSMWVSTNQLDCEQFLEVEVSEDQLKNIRVETSLGLE